MTRTSHSDESDLQALDEARARTIAATGWGAQLTFFQPRNLAFWVWAALVAWGGTTAVVRLSAPGTYYAPTIALSFFVFALYGALFWWFTQRIDRYASQPVVLCVMAFLWGGFVAGFILAATANNALFSLYSKWISPEFALDWAGPLSVPFSEEWSKGLGLVLLIVIAPHLVRTAFDGFILGAFLGLGFQIFENILYIIESAGAGFGVDQLGATVSTFLLRIGTGVGSHIAMTAIFCTGLVFLIGRPAQPRRPGLGAALILTAMFVHFLWDANAAIVTLLVGKGATADGLTFMMSVVVPLLVVGIVLWVFRLAVSGERAMMNEMLAPEVARDVIGEEEKIAASGNRKVRARYSKTRSGGGHRRRNHHVLEAVFDLAGEVGRSGGADSERVEFARGEVRRLRNDS